MVDFGSVCWNGVVGRNAQSVESWKTYGLDFQTRWRFDDCFSHPVRSLEDKMMVVLFYFFSYFHESADIGTERRSLQGFAQGRIKRGRSDCISVVCINIHQDLPACILFSFLFRSQGNMRNDERRIGREVEIDRRKRFQQGEGKTGEACVGNGDGSTWVKRCRWAVG